MPKVRYENIYRDLKEKIETNTFAYQEFLPPEHTLVQIYGCSRNTLRRAVGLLVTDGYVGQGRAQHLPAGGTDLLYHW